MSWTIKELELEDLTEELYESVPKELKNVSLEEMKSIMALRLAGHTTTIICIMDDKFIGMAGLTIDYKLDGTKIGFFEDLNVAPEYQNQGFGRIITNCLQYTAWDKGCDKILGYADRDSYASRIHPKLGASAIEGIWWQKENPRDGITREGYLKTEKAKQATFL